MNKRILAIIISAVGLCAVIGLFVAIEHKDSTIETVSKSDTVAASASDSYSAVGTQKLSIDAASASADRMLKLSCGSVTEDEMSFQGSAFNMDFVPQEPEYVERFRNYDGEKAKSVPVLMYHYFYDADVEEPSSGTNSHSIQSMRIQLEWLWENNYVTITMDELYEWLNGNIELPARCVMLTSDDGRDDFYKLLQPELKKYGFVATSFVITSKCDIDAEAFTIPMSERRKLTNIEMHSHTHDMHHGTIESGGVPDNRGIIQGIDIDEGTADMKKSSDILGGSKYMAYPYGTYGGNAKTILKNAGYRLAFTTTNGFVERGDDPLQLDRIRVCGSVSAAGLAWLIHADDVM